MPFLSPYQQRQSAEGTSTEGAMATVVVCNCSVVDAMVSSAAASSLLATTSEAANTTLVNYAIPFQNPVVTPTIPGTYSAATYTYTCTQTGPYLFSVSAAVPGMLLSV